MLTVDSGSAAALRSLQRKGYVMFFTQALEGRLNLRVKHTEDRKVRKKGKGIQKLMAIADFQLASRLIHRPLLQEMTDHPEKGSSCFRRKTNFTLIHSQHQLNGKK